VDSRLRGNDKKGLARQKKRINCEKQFSHTTPSPSYLRRGNKGIYYEI